MTDGDRAPAVVARRIFDGLAKRDLEAAMALVAEDAVDDFVVLGSISGRTAIRRFFEELLTAFPDFEMHVERIVGDDNTAVVQWHAAGAFTGSTFQGIEPTAKHVEVRGVDVMEISEGLVRHNTIYYDGASFARQIGMLPRSGSLADKGLLSAFNATTRLRRRGRG